MLPVVRPNRSAGLLLHPTSLPGPFGIGDLGSAAHAWVDTLQRAKMTWWQVLPLGPTGFGDSPYQSFSTFAGNVNLISPELLVRDGLLSHDDLGGHSFPADRVDYEKVGPFKLGVVKRAYENFRTGHAGHLRGAYEAFVGDRQAWLPDFALFMALKDARNGEPWYDWPPELLHHGTNSPVLEHAAREMADEIGAHQFGQFLFFRQWADLRRYAREKGIKLIGDVPIFVSGDSADVWANPKLYLLDENLRPKVVAGVPPDYFSRTGQLWGNPHYDWAAMAETGYAWWVARLKAALEQVDLVRLDHFRGFAAAWQVPAGEKTAERGEWVVGPGMDFFRRLRLEFGHDLPLIAEDLGEITPDVYALRDDLNLPGMKILQFAFDGPKNPFLPHNYTAVNCVAYSGTHDNDTTRGWWAQAPEGEKHYFRMYTGRDGSDVSWDLIRLAWSSVADYAIAPVQDVLDLPTEERMNLPGTGQGNWRYRMRDGAVSDFVVHRLRELTEIYGRGSRE
jgi:4-alpha-glucanotransferase